MTDPQDPAAMIQAADIWTTQGAADRIDIYSTNQGIFEPREDDPDGFDFLEGGWEGLAREIAGETREAGEKMYTHGVGHLDGVGDDRAIVYDEVVRGSGVAGQAQPAEGWGL